MLKILGGFIIRFFRDSRSCTTIMQRQWSQRVVIYSDHIYHKVIGKKKKNTHTDAASTLNLYIFRPYNKPIHR